MQWCGPAAIGGWVCVSSHCQYGQAYPDSTARRWAALPADTTAGLQAQPTSSDGLTMNLRATMLPHWGSSSLQPSCKRIRSSSQLQVGNCTHVC